jgi:MFS transporter, FHS family, Na+ dependent glucose transporter 1
VPASRSTPLHLGSFIALGCSTLILAPSLETFRLGAHVTKGTIGVLFTAGAVGYMLGSMAAGRLLAIRKAHHVLAAGTFIAAATLIGLTAVHHLVALMALQFVLGAGGGLIDVTGNSVVLWEHKGGAVMNALHLFFGIGATLAPVIVSRSLAWTDGLRAGYLVVALTLVAFGVWALLLPGPENPHEVGSRGFPAGRMRLLGLGLCFFVAYVGLEVGFIAWIFDYGVAKGLDRNSQASWLGTAFLASFTVGRLISVPLATRLTPKRTMFTDLGLCTLGMFVMIAGRNSLPPMWIGTIIFGLGTASMFPTMLSLAEPNLPSTSAVTSSFLIGSSIGSMSIPWLIGAAVDRNGTNVLPIAMLIGIAACLAAVLTFLRLAEKLGAATVRVESVGV